MSNNEIGSLMAKLSVSYIENIYSEFGSFVA